MNGGLFLGLLSLRLALTVGRIFNRELSRPRWLFLVACFQSFAFFTGSRSHREQCYGKPEARHLG
jgi:hypothetical protein